MKRMLPLILAMLVGVATTSAQNGNISESMLKDFRENVEKNQKVEALQNAASNNEIKKLALDRDNRGTIDNHFTHRIETKGITDQKSSGRCWLFTGLNIMRPKVIEKYNLKEFDFSQNYSFFYDQLEKSNLFLEGIIETADNSLDDRKVEWLFDHALGDGGQWTGLVDIVGKYGVVPKGVMPETHSSESTGWMSRLIERKIKAFGLELREMHENGKPVKAMRKAKKDMLAEVYKMLSINLGEPPQEFTWRYKDAEGNLSELKTYTPQSFYEEFVGVELSDYVMFMNDPSRPYNKLYEIEYDRHRYDGHNWKYINLKNEKLKEFAIASIKDNEGMYMSCDVGKQLDKENGILDSDNYNFGALFDTEFTMNKEERIITSESGSSHGMMLAGVDLKENGEPRKWLLENSWGPKSGYEGYLIMTDSWFDEYLFRLVIHKKYISDDVLKILEQEPTMLPPWDPMY